MSLGDGNGLPAPANGHRGVLDWHLNLNGVITTLALLFQVAVIVLGGIWAEARVQTRVESMVEQLSGVRDEIKGIRADVAGNSVALRREMSEAVSRLDHRIDQLPTRIEVVPAPAAPQGYVPVQRPGRGGER